MKKSSAELRTAYDKYLANLPPENERDLSHAHVITEYRLAILEARADERDEKDARIIE